MAVAFRSSTTKKYASTTNTTVNKPAGVVDGDFLVALFSMGAGSGITPSTPAGWAPLATFTDITAAGFTVRNHVYTKTASGEGASWTWNHATNTAECTVTAWTGVDLATPISPSLPAAMNTTGAGSNTTTTATGVTTPRNGSAVIFFGQDWGDTANTLTAPTGSTPTFTEQVTIATSSIQSIAYGIMATAGATGDKTQTSNSITANPRGGVLIVLQPPADGISAFQGNAFQGDAFQVEGASVSAVAAIRWDSAHTGPNITLSNTDLTASNSGSSTINSTRSNVPGDGKRYCEILEVNTLSVVDVPGVCQGAMGSTSYPGQDTNGYGLQLATGDFLYNSGTAASGLNSAAAGDYIGMAIDFDAKLIWYRTTTSPNWNNNPANDPSTGVGGVSFSTLTAPIYLALSVFNTPEVFTVNFGLTAFNTARPAGFLPWTTISGTARLNGAGGCIANTKATVTTRATFAGAGGCIADSKVYSPARATFNGVGGFAPNTTEVSPHWDSKRTSAGTTLSNNNNTATKVTDLAHATVRSNVGYLSGKRYYEGFIGNTVPGNELIGICLYALAVDGVPPGGDTNGIGLNGADASVYYNGSPYAAGVNGWLGANYIAIAVDLDAKLIWWRSTNIPNWNNSGTANPATGVGGVTFSGLGGGSGPYYIAVSQYNATVTHDANWGQSAFNWSIPLGFTSWDGSQTGSAAALQASATLNGAGSLSCVVGLVTKSNPATLPGVGSLSALPAVITRGSTLFAGTGSLTSDSKTYSPGKATFAGAGGFSASAILVQSENALLAGSGSLSALAQVVTSGSARLNGAGGFVANVTEVTPHWDTYRTSTAMTLSNLNNTVTKTGNDLNHSIARSNVGHASGKRYYEGFYGNTVETNEFFGIGIGALAIDGQVVGSTTTGLGLNGDGNVYYNSSPVYASVNNWAGATYVAIAVDLDAKLIWWRSSLIPNWNNNAANNPATGVGGLDMSFLGNGTEKIYIALSMFNLTVAHDANWGQQAFNFRIPNGFTSWDGSQTGVAIAWQGTASLNGVGSLRANAAIISRIAATFAGDSSLSALPEVITRGSALLAGDSTLTVANTLSTQKAAATLPGVGSLAANAFQLGTVLGSAVFAGAGTFTARAIVRTTGSALLAGVGSLSGNVLAQTRFAAATLPGVGNLSTLPIVRTTGSAQLVGAGGFLAVSSLTLRASARLAGAGDFEADSLGGGLISAELAGSGSLAATGALLLPTGAAFEGAGGCTANAIVLGAVHAAATMVGAGGCSALAVLQRKISAVLAGQGALVAVTSRQTTAAAAFAGVGGRSAKAQLLQATSALLSGQGKVDAFARVKGAPIAFTGEATLPGSGSLQVGTRQWQQGWATLTGQGGLIFAGRLRMLITARLSGLAAGSAQATVYKRIAARLVGTGSLTADTKTIARGKATFKGTGQFVVGAMVYKLAAAHLDGVGSLRASAKAKVAATVHFAGTGTLRTTTRIKTTGVARLAGVGGFVASARVVKHGAAIFAGAGNQAAVLHQINTAHAKLPGTGKLTVVNKQTHNVGVHLDGRGGLRVTNTVKGYITSRMDGAGHMRVKARQLFDRTLVGRHSRGQPGVYFINGSSGRVQARGQQPRAARASLRRSRDDPASGSSGSVRTILRKSRGPASGSS